MRVTTSMVANSVGTNLNNLRRRLSRVETQMATGKTILKMGDGPALGSEVLRLNTAHKTLDHWEANQNDLHGWLYSTEGALIHMTNSVQRLRDLTIQGATATNPQDALDNLAMEVQAILEDLLSTANQRHAGYFMFAGHRTDTKPFEFDFDTGEVTYLGDEGASLREVGPGVVLQANLPGDTLKDIDLFNTAWQIAKAFRDGEYSLAGDLLEDVDKARDAIITARAVVGVRANRLEQARSQAIDSRVNLTMLLEQAQGVEYERAILELKMAEIAYQTALQVGARIIPPTLVDFLR
jgi:flagellar hook-associated protein 3 FlgL